MNNENKDEEILILTGPLKETIWGSNFFNEKLHLTNQNNIGEMWSCSGYDNFSSIIKNGIFKGNKLSDVYKNHKDLFTLNSSETFPILIKLISTNDKLSIQVHPGDDYAKKYENSLGKSECWLILDKGKESKLILGNNATSKENLKEFVEHNQYDKLINEVDINIGDVYPVNPGTIHGIGKDILLLEIQQSSDVTYRFYDYNRLGIDGKPRELHVKKAMDVTVPGKYNEKIVNIYKDNVKEIVKNKYFYSYYENINGIFNYYKEDNEFSIITSLCDKLEINNKYVINYGESFIVTNKAKKVLLKGEGKIIISKANN